ncbi:TRAP transporter large permease subunit [Brevibacillus massiliensis]|uniref:TRAP transporter large permease subunit n=1 Tax=Brevibacillus massiliensis TaxID=1118054 RepID=UPI0004753F59|nr:TRAP transporter large permease subunit [Brevibacillus massiliensis]
MSVLTAPALENLGVPLIAAHMFILFFGVFADITPPVALASYAGAVIAGSSPMNRGHHDQDCRHRIYRSVFVCLLRGLLELYRRSQVFGVYFGFLIE